MKKHFPTLLILLAILTNLPACKKSNNGENRMELATNGTWYYEDAGIDGDGNGTGETDIPPGTIPDCQLDNSFTLMTDGTGVADEGATKCDPGDPQTSPLTWSFSNNETVLTLNSAVFAGVSGDFEIITLNQTTLILSKEITVPGLPFPVTVVATFGH